MLRAACDIHYVREGEHEVIPVGAQVEAKQTPPGDWPPHHPVRRAWDRKRKQWQQAGSLPATQPILLQDQGWWLVVTRNMVRKEQ